MTREERSKKYKCNGICYPKGEDETKIICPNIDTCPETCNKEFIATIGAILCIIGIPIIGIIGLIIYLINILI